MNGPMGFVDLHSHVLPRVDDGAPDLETSVAMLRGLAAAGFSHVFATPHQKSPDLMPTMPAMHAAHALLSDALATAGTDLSLGLAAENFWDHIFFDRLRDGSFPRYDGGRAFLFEVTPNELPARFEDTIFHISTKGFFPVMAHPERYAPFWRDLDRLDRLGKRCALVVDLGALSGAHGWREGRIARRLVAERIAHAAASDVHSLSDVQAAAEGIAWIRKKLGEDAVTRLLDENPRAISKGELPDP